MWWHQVAGIGNSNVACLLGNISVQNVLTPKDMARASAVMRVAAVTLLHGLPVIPPFIQVLGEGYPQNNGNRELFADRLLEFITSPDNAELGFIPSPNAELARKGPIWAAVGIWTKIRSTMSIYDTN